MATQLLRVDIVSAEREIFSGDVASVVATGEMGELGIFPGHTPLLTPLKPGDVTLDIEGKHEIFYISGGLMEVQSHLVTVLADTVVRAEDIDEAAALEAKTRAEHAMRDSKEQLDYMAAVIELAQAMAQLKAINRLKER